MQLRAIPAVLAILALSAGCAVHQPQVADHPAEMPAAYIEGPAGEPAPPLDRWWQAFGDERLDALMAAAFAANLDLRQAYARLEQLESASRSAAAGLRPTLNLTAAAGRSRQAGPLGTVTDDAYRLSAAAGYELDLWQKIRSRVDAAELDTLASAEDLKTVYLSLSAQIADLYFLAREQQAQLALADRTIASFADTLARVEHRYRQGLVPALDVYQSRQNLAQAKSRRPVFAANLAVAEHALSVLTGRFPERGLAGDSLEIPLAPADLPVGLPAQLLERRPDIRASLLRLRASDERIGAAIADRFPAFNLTGEAGGASTALSTLLDSGNVFWNLLVGLAQPVVDGGRRQAEVARTRAVFREDLAAYHQAVLRAMQEVEDALANGQATAERISSLEERVAATESGLRLATDRYLQGLSDYLPVLTAQTLHFDAQSALLIARRQLVADRIQLARSLGGGWMEPLVEERRQGAVNRES